MTAASSALLWILSSVAAHAAGAGPAPIDLERLESLQSEPIRWESVKVGPALLRGRTGRCGLRLSREPPAVIWLGSGSVLRVRSCGSGGALNEVLAASASDGSGLAVRLAPMATSDPGAVLLVPPSPGPMLVRVWARTGDLEAAVEVATPASPRFPPQGPRLDLDAPDVDVTERTAGRVDRYDRLSRGQSASARVEGPARLTIVTAPVLDEAVQAWDHAYRIDLSLDARPWRALTFSTAPAVDRSVRIDGRRAVIGEPEVRALEIPPGAHSLGVRASGDLVIRMIHGDGSPVLAVGPNGRVPALDSAGDTAIDRAQALARDNGWRASALGASAELRAHLKASPVPGRIASAASRLRSARTLFRDLLPAGRSARGFAQAFAYVLERPLLEPSEQPLAQPVGRTPMQMPAALASAAADTVTGARFVRAESGDELTFVLPARDGPSRLRVLAASGAGRSLELRLDDGAPTSMEELDDDSLLSPDMVVVAPGLAAIASLPRSDSGFDGGTTGGAFASRRPPAPLIRAGSATVGLPTGVRTVKLRVAGGRPSYVAVQFLASAAFSPPSDEYAALLEEAGGEGGVHDLFTSTMARAVECLSRDPKGTYCGAATVAPERTPREQALLNAWMVSFRVLASRYRDLVDLAGADPAAADGSPRAWGWCRAANSDTEVDTCLGRIDALARAGERNLARRLLAAVALRAPSARARTEAAARLGEAAKTAQDWDGLVGAAVARALDSPHPAAVAELVLALQRAGEHDAAARVGAVLGTSSPARHAALASAAASGDAFLVRYLARALPDAQRSAWEGHACQVEGRVGCAISAYESAGPSAATWAERSREGVRIRDRLASPDPAERARAGGAWAEWLDGDRREVGWFDASHLVTAFAAGASTYAPTRDAHASAYVAGTEVPVRVAIAGPARLRVEARPILPRADESFAGWLKIRSGADELSIPVDSTPSPSLTLVGGDAVIGTAAVAVVDVPPGLREVTIGMTKAAALVRVDVERSMIPVAALPPATPAAISAALRGNWRQASIPVDRCRWCFELVEAGSAIRLDSHREPDPIEVPAPASWTSAGAGHLALLAPRQDVARVLNDFENGDGPTADAALARAGSIRLEHLTDPAVVAAWDRIQSASIWEPVEPDASDGFQDVRVSGSSVEAPRLRARVELLPALTPNAQVLYGTAPVSLDLGVPAPTKVLVKLAHLTVPTHEPFTRAVLYRVDDDRERSVMLDGRGKDARFGLDLPPGRHRLTFRLERPLPNRFVLLKLEQKGVGTTLSIERERRYWIATPAAPVSVGVVGPAWIRIDELVENGIRSTERFVSASLQRLELRPANGRRQALFRVLRLVRAPPIDPRRPPPEPRSPVPAIPRAPIVAGASSAPAAVAIRDVAPADSGWGTLTLGSAWARARTEEGGAIAADERVGPFATWRRLDRWRGLHEELGVVARVRGSGPASFGAAGRVEIEGLDPFLSVRASTSFFTQASAWSWAGRVAVDARFHHVGRTSHQLALELFGRALAGWDARTTDPDVYTPYADQHRRGAELSYALVHRPWLDTRGMLLASLTTNPDFVGPDRAGGAARLDQRLGPAAVGVRVWVSRYLSDGARTSETTRAGLGALVSWDIWASARRRLELGATVERRLSEGTWLGGIELAWHFSGGFEDFAPGDRPFLELDRLRGAQRTGSEVLPHEP